MARMNLRFLYVFADDLDAMRTFYSDLIGLDEFFHAAGADGGLGYRCDRLQFTILPDPDAVRADAAWHRQPGWEGGTLLTPSWSIESESREAFAAAVDRLRAAGVPLLHDQPRWVGYWSFPVRDPMGNTVELTLPAPDGPADRTWGEG